MEIRDVRYWSLSTLCIVTCLYLQQVVAETVYMDRYGDCFHEGPIEVEDDMITIHAQGGAAYDTLLCEMTFKSIKNDGLCLSFTEFQVDRCDLKLYVYSGESSSSKLLGTYTCDTHNHPDTVCSEGKYLTVLRKKKQLSHHGYDFTLTLGQYSQAEGLAHSSTHTVNMRILMISGVIVSILVVVILTTVVIISCRRYSLSPSRKASSASRSTQHTDVLQPIQPSAPPLEEPPAYCEHPPPYTTASAPQCTDLSNNTDEQKAFI